VSQDCVWLRIYNSSPKDSLSALWFPAALQNGGGKKYCEENITGILTHSDWLNKGKQQNAPANGNT
jgi:hypothetical protein